MISESYNCKLESNDAGIACTVKEVPINIIFGKQLLCGAYIAVESNP